MYTKSKPDNNDDNDEEQKFIIINKTFLIKVNYDEEVYGVEFEIYTTNVVTLLNKKNITLFFANNCFYVKFNSIFNITRKFFLLR